MTPQEEAQAYVDAYDTNTREENLSVWKRLTTAAKKFVSVLDRDRIVKSKNLVDPIKEHLSPSGKYKLTIGGYNDKEGRGWEYSQGLVYRQGSDEPIADVRRNYSAFPFTWVESHANGHDYLVCGEDYQGQTVIELDTGRRRDHLPKEAADGFGFCWAAHSYDAEHKVLFVDGCYWACPYEWRAYDFSDPMEKGWPQLETFDEAGERVSVEASHKTPDFQEGRLVFYETKSVEDCKEYDEEDVAALITSKGLVRQEMAELVWEGEGDSRYAVVATQAYRREGDKLLLQTYGVHDLEKIYREYREGLRKEYEAHVANFKATDPLYLAFVEGCKDPALSPESHLWRGFTHENWCSEWKGEESRWGKDLVTEGPVKISLEWAEKTGPVLLISVRDGKKTTEVFMDHSAASIQAAFARAKELLAG